MLAFFATPTPPLTTSAPDEVVVEAVVEVNVTGLALVIKPVPDALSEIFWLVPLAAMYNPPPAVIPSM